METLHYPLRALAPAFNNLSSIVEASGIGAGRDVAFHGIVVFNSEMHHPNNVIPGDRKSPSSAVRTLTIEDRPLRTLNRMSVGAKPSFFDILLSQRQSHCWFLTHLVQLNDFERRAPT